MNDSSPQRDEQALAALPRPILDVDSLLEEEMADPQSPEDVIYYMVDGFTRRTRKHTALACNHRAHHDSGDSEGCLMAHPYAHARAAVYIFQLLYAMAFECDFLYSWRSEVLAWAVLQLAYHPVAFADATQLFLHLIDKHVTNRTILNTVRGHVYVLADCEFSLILMVAKRFKTIFTDPKKDQNDPSLLLPEFFDKFQIEARYPGRFYFLRRLERFLIKRQTGWIKASFVVANSPKVPQGFPAELLRKLQDSMYDGDAVREMLEEVYEEESDFLFGEHRTSAWLLDVFNDAGL